VGICDVFIGLISFFELVLLLNCCCFLAASSGTAALLKFALWGVFSLEVALEGDAAEFPTLVLPVQTSNPWDEK
jgi:hypothetical protein